MKAILHAEVTAIIFSDIYSSRMPRQQLFHVGYTRTHARYLRVLVISCFHTVENTWEFTHCYALYAIVKASMQIYFLFFTLKKIYYYSQLLMMTMGHVLLVILLLAVGENGWAAWTN